MRTRPFKFRLKKVSGKEQALIDAIYSFLPSIGLEENFSKGIEESVSSHLNDIFSFRLERLHYVPYSSFLGRLPQTAVMAVLGLAPLSGKAIIELDAPLAILGVERMLGSRSKSLPMPRELTDTEEGVLQFLILQILSHVHSVCGKDASVHFRFDRFAFRSHEVRELAGENDGVAVLVFRIELGRHSGFVRLCLPDPFVEEGLLNVKSHGEENYSAREKLVRGMERFGYVKAPMWAEVGRTTLTGRDLAELEEGDVILFDEAMVMLADGHPSGMAVLRVGMGLQGGIDAEITLKDRKVSCRITGLHKGD